MRTHAPLLACARAATTADACNKHPFTIETWSVEPARDGFALLTAEIRLKTASGTRMVEGQVWFTDVLGRLLGNIPLDPDLAIAPGELATVADHQPAGRFLTVEQNDMRVATCVRAVVYEDGSVERV